MPTWGVWVILAGLLTLRALLGAVETSLQQLTDAATKILVLRHPRRGGRIARLKADPEQTAAALRTAMVLCGFTAAAIGVLVPPRLLNTTLTAVLQESSWLVSVTALTAALLVAFIATALDLIARSTALQNPEAFGLSLSWLGVVTKAVMYPAVRVIVGPLNLVLALFGSRVTFQPPPPPLEELERLITAQAKDGELDRNAPALIRGVFELSDKTVRDVMVPRTDVVAIALATPVPQILQLVAEQNHSRIPVYDEDMDRIIGVLHVRDLVPMLQTPGLIVLRDVIRPVVFVPWVKPIGDLLGEMQKQRIHMAVVVDEYGGFSGIVTLEDILREIVGDIGDEFEEAPKPVERLPDGSYVIDASMHRDEFRRTLDHWLPDGEFETVAGYLSHLAGAIPDVGERFTVNGWTFSVLTKDGPRLDRVQVQRPKTPVERRNSRELDVSSVVAPRPSR